MTGNDLRELRKIAKVSSGELALALGVPRILVSAYETKNVEIPAADAVRIKEKIREILQARLKNIPD